MEEGRKINAARRLHYAFSALYGVLALIIVSATIFGINYETTFQTGLLAFNVGVAFLLLASTGISRRTQRRVSEYIIYREYAVIISVTCAVSIVFTAFYLYNVIYILSVKCPEFQNNGHVAPHVELLLVSYVYPHRAITKQNVLLLRYNATTRSLVRRKQADHRWFAAHDRYQHQKSAYDVLMALPEAERRATSAFHFLEQEVQLALEENLHAMGGGEEQRGFSVAQSQDSTLNREEENIFLELKARRICRNEYGFAVFWVVFLCLLVLFNLLTIGVYAWIKY